MGKIKHETPERASSRPGPDFNTLTDTAELVECYNEMTLTAKDLGLKTLAEGVETIGQMDLLRSSNVVEVQGFLFSHPLEPDLLESQILEPMRFSGMNNPPRSL